MILLKRLLLRDFLSHENTKLDFYGKDQLLIDGASGHGKSSIFDAIIWALYGEGRVDNRSLVRKGAQRALVTLELQNGEETVIITRSVTSAGKHTLAISTESAAGVVTAHPLTGVRELQLWIDKELVGASYLLFINSVAYVQGSAESFVAQTAPKRKELLLEIVKADDYKKYYEKARSNIGKFEAEEQKLLGQILELENQKKALETRLGGKAELFIEILKQNALAAEIPPKMVVLEGVKQKLLSAHSIVNALNQVYTNNVDSYRSLDAKIVKNKALLGEKDSLLKTLENRPSLITQLNALISSRAAFHEKFMTVYEEDKKYNEVKSKRPTVADRSREIAGLENMIKEREGQLTCPSGDACPFAKTHVNEIKLFKEQIDVNKKRSADEAVAMANWAVELGSIPIPTDDPSSILTLVRKEDEKISAKQKEIDLLDSAQRKLDALIPIENEITSLEIDLTTKKLTVDKSKVDLEEAEAGFNKEEFNRISSEITNLQTEEKAINEKITRAKAMLEALDRDEEEVRNLGVKIEEIHKTELFDVRSKIRKLELIKDAFGSKGIETMVIDYLLPRLEDQVNEILAKLSDFRVRLDTQKKTADGEGVVEGLFITIINDSNEELPFESYSGGEKLKISVSISEALATLQKVGFRLFDETFLGLDENSTESFANVLVSLQKRFGQVMCISHLAQIKDLFDKKVVVCKTNGISYVK